MLMPLIGAIQAIFSNFLNFFSNEGITFYFYDDIFLFLGVVVSLSLNYKSLIKMARRVDRKYYLMLLAVILLFLAIALVLVTPTFMIYNDEYIYGAIGKSMIFNHLAGICSFSSANYCMPGTEGLFHQPTGWAFLEAIAFLVTGVKIPTMFGLELIVSTIAVILIFYVAYDLFDDQRIAVASSMLLALTPIFMRYARSAVPDMSTAMFGLLSILLLMEYMRTKKFSLGIAAVFATVYTMTTKVDGIVIIPVLMSVLLLYRYNFSGTKAKAQVYKLLLLIVVLAIVALPQVMFLLIANQHGFGVNPGLPKFSLSDFLSNLKQNTLFWFGAYTDAVFQYEGTNYIYNVEFPITYTLFAIAGLFFAYKQKRYRNLVILGLWFLIIFIFYTAYYAGGALYSNGDDIRYFLLAFPVISIFASLTAISAYDLALTKMRKRVRKNEMRKLAPIILFVIFAVLLSEGLVQIFTIVAQNPSQYFAFAAERASYQMIESYYNEIPSNSMIVTFKPPLWYLLGRPNIYVSWITIPTYASAYANLSKNGVYFDYGISCSEGARAYYQSTAVICNDFMNTHITEPLVVEPFDKDSWNTSLGIYKVLGTVNSTSNSSNG
ncbi:MAG: glycosyltransferase family 39 protein [Candidatus Micrarchaeaceae archaeon]